MKAPTKKARTEEVRLHSSTRTVGGRSYPQTCVRWYEAGVRRQKCFGQLADAEEFRDSILTERAKAVRIPRGLRVVIESLGTGKRLLVGKDGATFLQSRGGTPEPLPMLAALVALGDLFASHDGNTMDDGVGFVRLLEAVSARLARLENLEASKGGA